MTAAPRTTEPATTAVLGLDRRVPALGGFSGTFLRLEVRRLLRNRRTLMFSVVMPPLFYFLFGASQHGESVGRGNVSAYVMISLAVYGAMTSATSAGAMVAVERAQGWSRQLRLTPLHPAAYVATKVLSALVLSAFSVLAVFVAGALGGARADGWVWVAAALIAWVGSLVFACLGLFLGYLLPSENAMQFVGLVLTVLSFLGGLFVPLTVLSDGFRTLASWTPAYGVGVLARAPLTSDHVDPGAVLNVVVWAGLFAAGAVWRFRRDTARV